MQNLVKLFGVVIAVAVPVTQASAERIYGLAARNTIVTFDSATPGTFTSVGAISGIGAGETLSGLDLRPANRTLYSISSSGKLYAIVRDGSGTGYTATAVGTLGTPRTGNASDIDFNPVVDRLRSITDSNQNLRINPDTALTLVDTPVTLNGSSAVDIVATAYANSRPGAVTTVLYGIDAATDSLVRATNANAGTFTNTNLLGNVFGPLGFNVLVTDRAGFDISGRTGQAFFSIRNRFYTVDQTTGVGRFVGTVGADISGFATAAVPEPASWALMIAGFGLVGSAMRRRRGARVVAA